MKAQAIVINILVAVVAVLAGHVFWPGEPTEGTAVAQVQAAPASAPQPQSPVTPELRVELGKARMAALAADPTLKTEEDDLIKQRNVLMKQGSTATAEDKNALMVKLRAHANKMRQGMVNADPSLQPFFAEMDARLKARQLQLQGQVSPASGNPRPALIMTNASSAKASTANVSTP